MRALRWSWLLSVGILSTGCSVSSGGGESVEGGEPMPGMTSIEPGTLTAGAWDDNRNYEFFAKYVGSQKELAGAPTFDKSELDAAHLAFAGERPLRQSLDIAFVVDNTGSMGDEIDYLKVEFTAIASRIHDRFPTIPIRYATVAYRDYSDDFVTRTSDFSGDSSAARDAIGDMEAGGGDDYPEAVAAALEATNELDWKAEARLVFWIADAPSHDDEGDDVADAVRTARDHGVNYYPVAASGADDLTELTMRSAAQITGGRYLFLTDDSGVGGPHKEPRVPCYFVTKLDRAVERMVSIEVSGQYAEPSQDEIIRTGGDPHDGACELDSGETVAVF